MEKEFYKSLTIIKKEIRQFMTTIGYMRISTTHQKFDSQMVALTNYGVDKIFKEQESGRKEARTELNKAICSLNPGDTFVVYKLDRLARSTRHLLQLMDIFEKKSINFISLENNIDTSTPMGKFFFTVMSAFSEMEANLIRERVLSGLEAAKEKGTTLGRPVMIDQVEQALTLYTTTNLAVSKIAEECNLSTRTVYNHIKKKKFLETSILKNEV